jgi:non-specific serine/threonine protein kinase
MAAARSNAFTPAQIAEYLDDRFHFLTTDPGAIHERHSSLAAAFDWSYDLLSPDRQLLFDRLSIFEGPFDIAACLNVSGGADVSTGAVTAGLAALVDASMVAAMRSDESMRYRLLDTLRIYGRERLAARGESACVAERHSRYFLGLAEASGRARMTPEHKESVAVLDNSNDDLRAALDWSLDNEERSVTMAAAPGLAQYWNRRGDPTAALHYGTRMLNGADGVSSGLQAAARTCVAFGALMTGDLETATSAMGQIMQLLEGGDDWKTLLWVLNVQGTSALFAGDPAGAAQAGARMLDVCSDHGVTLPRAYGLSLMGQAEFFADGDLELARGYFEEAVPLFGILGDEAAQSISGLVFLAAIAGLQGEYAAAERYGIEATGLGGPGWSAAALVIFAAHVLHPKGELDRAERALARGLLAAHERSIEVWARTALLMLGRIAADRGHWEKAARLHGASRPNLPRWMSHPRWREAEERTREALGRSAFEAIAAAGEAEPIDHVVLWAVEGTAAL